MTPRELLTSANSILMYRTATSRNAVACAEHILATVYADDGEDVTKEWFQSIATSTLDGCPSMPDRHDFRKLVWFEYGLAIAYGNDQFDALPLYVQNRKQFRAACECFNVEYPVKPEGGA